MTRRGLPREVLRNARVEAYITIQRAASALLAHLQAVLKKHELSEPQFNVLRILRGGDPRGLPCQEISHTMITRVPDITRLVDRLETRGLVERGRMTSDRRIVLVTITDRGLDLLAEMDQPVLDVHESQFVGWNEEQLDTLTRLLGRLVADQEGGVNIQG